MLVYILETYLRESRTKCLDDMSSLTNALFLRLHIWIVVPLGVYGWTHALKRGRGNFHVSLTWYVPFCMV